MTLAIQVALLTVVLAAAPLSSLAQQIDNDKADAVVNAYITSPAYAGCTNGNDLAALIKSIPCVAKKNMQAAQAFLDYLNSFDGQQQRMALARQLSKGDGTQEASLLGTWDGLLEVATTQIREMQQKQIVATLVNYPKAPVTLTSCSERHMLDDPQWEIAATWEPSARALTAVKIRIETQDAFGSTLQTNDLSPTGTYPAWTRSGDSWTVGDLHMPSEANVSRIRCTIIAAAFADGSIWNATKLVKGKRKH